MKHELLSQLQCPCAEVSNLCGGELEIDDSIIQPEIDSSAGEIRDAFLVCRKCRHLFPVIAGVPILLNDLFAWLRTRYRPIMAGAATVGGVNPGMNTWLEDHGWHLASEPPDNFREGARWVNIFTSSHYDAVSGGADDESELGRFLSGQISVFDAVSEMILKHRPDGFRRAIDIGGNVGGMAWRAAAYTGEVLGIDLTFNPILAARRIQIGAPVPQTVYRRYMDGNIFIERPIEGARDNTEFAVCSALELPFRGKFDLLFLLNIIDGVPQPRRFLSHVLENLEPGGFVVITSPYSWGSDMSGVDHWLGGTPGNPSPVAMVGALRDAGLTILEDIDNVPWILREHQRWYRVFLNHCVVARKS